jgi:WD40 repeat protein
MRYFILVLLCLFGLFVAQGQDFSPSLWVKSQEGKFSALAIKKYKAESTVIGLKVFTTLTIDFETASKTAKEGIFILPIGKPHHIRRFAVQIDSAMREAIVLESSQNDSHLLRLSADSTQKFIDIPPISYPYFSYTIQQIKANKAQKIVIEYDYEMDFAQNQYRFLLPMPKNTVEKLQITIHTPTKPIALQTEYKQFVLLQTDNLQQNKVANNYQSYDFQAFNFLPKYAFACDFAADMRDKIFTAKSRFQPNAFFYAEIMPCELADEERPLPKKIVIFYDQSYSAKNRNRELELNLLNRYLKKVKDVQVQVIGFANEVQNDKTFEIKDGAFNDLRKYLYGLDFDGGTNLHELDFDAYPADEYIIFSDGDDDFGKKTTRRHAHKPVICLNSAKQNSAVPPPYLFELAMTSGGVYLNLNTTPVNEALKQMLFLPCQFIGFDYDKSSFGNIQMQRTPQGILLAGKLFKELGKITLKYGSNGKFKHSKEIEIAAGNYGVATLLEGIWAAMELENLSKNYLENHKIIRELSKKYAIAAKGTSWFLPETVADYLHYGLEPPADLYAFYKKYISHQNINLQNSDNEEITTEQYAFKKVSNLYAKRRSWYDKDFTADIEDELDYGRTDFTTQDGAESSVYFWSLQEVLTDSALTVQHKNPVHTSNETVYKAHEQYTFAPLGFEGQTWTEEKDYLRTLEAAEEKNRYRSYKALRETQELNVSFYADVANLFFEWGEKETAIKIISNVVELYPDNPMMLKILGNRLMAMKRAELALPIYERVLVQNPSNPHSYRDLGLCYAELGQMQQAIDYLYEVVANSWESKYLALQDLTIGEINHLLTKNSQGIAIYSMPSELRKPMTLDVRILLEWDNPNVDMDLYVIDPNDEKAYYGNTETKMGGRISTHTAIGKGYSYNPEEFILKHAEQGEYWVRIHRYQKNNQNLNTPTLVTLTMFTNYGRPNEERKIYTYRMTNMQEVIDAEMLEFNTNFRAKSNEPARYQTIKTAESVQLTAYSPDNRFIALAHDYDVSIYRADSAILQKLIKDVNVGGVLFKKMIFNSLGTHLLILGDSTLIPSGSMNDMNSESFWNDDWQEEGHISVIKLLNVEKGLLERSYSMTDSAITEISFTADGKGFFAISSYGISQFDLQTGKLFKNVIKNDRAFSGAAANKLILATADRSGITIRQTTDLQVITKINADSATDLRLAENGKAIAYLQYEKGKHRAYIVHFLAANKQAVSSFDLFFQTGIPKIGQFSLSPDAKYVAAQPFGTNQVVVKTTDAHPEDVIEYYHQNQIIALTFSPNTNLLSSASKDHIIRVRDMRKLPFGAIKTEGNEFDFDIDNQGLNLTIAEENNILFFNRRDAAQQKFLRQENFTDSLNIVPVEHAKNVVLSTTKDNAYVAYFDKVGTKKLLSILPLYLGGKQDKKSNNFAQTLLAPLETFGQNYDFKTASQLKISPDGKLLVFDADTNIMLLPLKSLKKIAITDLVGGNANWYYNQKCLETIKGHHGDMDKKRIEKVKDNANILCLEFSRDGKYMVSKGIDKAVKVWEAKTGECLSTYITQYDASSHVQFSADGKYLLFEDIEHNIKIWDWQTAKLIGELIGHKAPITYIDTEATGKYFISTAKDNSIRLWDTKTFACLQVYYDNAPRKVRFCDDKTFITTGKDTYLKFWRVY